MSHKHRIENEIDIAKCTLACLTCCSWSLLHTIITYFRSIVHTNTTPTVIKIVDQIGTSVSFWPKKWNAETLKAIVSQTAPLAKLSPGRFLFIHEIWRFQTICRIFLKEWSVSSLNRKETLFILRDIAHSVFNRSLYWRLQKLGLY